MGNTPRAESGTPARSAFFRWTEDRTEVVFLTIFLASLVLGTGLFFLLQYDVPSWWPATLRSKNPITDAGGASGFLQGAWGTAGAFAASFVAIVLARQALLLARQQKESQDGTDAQILALGTQQNALQTENNAIATRSTPEYAISFEAAAASMRLDTAQILIGTHERKKYRREGASTASLFEPYSADGSDGAIKEKIKAELLNSQLIKLSGELAEKLRGPQARLHVEALTAELTLGTHFTIDKFLINEFNELLRELVGTAHQGIQRTLEGGGVAYLSGYSRYAAATLRDGGEPLSESSYYFVYIQEQQKRLSRYSYEEIWLLRHAVGTAVSASPVPVELVDELPDFSASASASMCFISPFEFARGKLLTLLERSSVPFEEPKRGLPDVAVAEAIEAGAGQEYSFVLLDQVEQHVDSIATEGKWLTLEEHLKIWLACRELYDLMEIIAQAAAAASVQAVTPQWLWAQTTIQNFLRNSCLARVAETMEPPIACLMPRFYAIEGGAAIAAGNNGTTEGATNYDLLLREVALALGQSSGPYRPVQMLVFFITELFEWLIDMREEQTLTEEKAHQFEQLLAAPDFAQAVACIAELARRPYFERPFYGWFLPNRQCPRTTFAQVQKRFVGIHYLKEADAGYAFQATPLFQWLAHAGRADSPIMRAHLLAL